MTDVVHSDLPSLSRAFEPARQELRDIITPDMSAAQIVSHARRALDGTGDRFARDTSDPTLHKAGLWLLEMVKSGAGVLDRGTDATITWTEVGKKPLPKWTGRGLFYGSAGVFAVAGFVQGSGLAIMAAAVLAGLRFFDPKNWEGALARLPFRKKPSALEDMRGRTLQAEARITADAGGFIDSLADAIKTADHILLRLALPQAQTSWSDDTRLMGLVQGLLEARHAQDGDFALKLIGKELESVLAAEGVEIVPYSRKTQALFDVLPTLGEDGRREAAPALKSGDRVLCRGTVWEGRTS